MSFYTPLRYPGGKAQLATWVTQVLERNSLDGGTYVEPYAGGCGVAMHLLMNGAVSRIIINDADPAIYAFWWCALEASSWLHDRIMATEVTVAERERQRAILSSPRAHSPQELGFAAFYVNRTSRSGILSGGVIGGKAQNGRYKIDARYNRVDLVERLRRIAERRDQIELHGVDAMQLLKNLERRLSKHSLIYLDPPYYVKGAQLYRNFYVPKDHEDIGNAVKVIRTPWILTYDDCEPIRQIYAGSSSLTYSPYYSTHASRETATEIMVYGNLQLPSPPFMRRGTPASPAMDVARDLYRRTEESAVRPRSKA
ncbi:DNA adenine methylase [Xanthomonas sp. NCPPB 2632]|uniref:DNA adenine methylase n=1 Tax=Xanthomonas sp. NCPPB 2632 TaxID=3240912 RepID=UPI003514842A